ncbi:hypothetical protein HGP28_05475 [Vibrio sp. SM6]|uniref:Uncharacterized protein n=1 Tax=Vibrio agarilyticus TaxID=2726741 RepID=A0A7X8TPP5_9VIBR|nr:hypothetical protein [Vibrio agarilyticus]NLS12346.1 hypothetical protein [Vibrio agarilyticus]
MAQTDKDGFYWQIWCSDWQCGSVVTTWENLAEQMDQSLPEIIADRIGTGLEKIKAYEFLHAPYQEFGGP